MDQETMNTKALKFMLSLSRYLWLDITVIKPLVLMGKSMAENEGGKSGHLYIFHFFEAFSDAFVVLISMASKLHHVTETLKSM